ncbi:MAG: ion transporter [Gammaproteobacteria bacterium]|nr:ion transporter [Gammaproteobacteria bacterium]MDH5801834.1 ion transporter [Gammaproteobacteria bacterium]
MQNTLKKFVDSTYFEYGIVGLILINAVVLGLETSPEIVAKYNGGLVLLNNIILAVFVLEAILKIAAVAPRLKLYFGDGWNLFDFTVVVVSLIPATGEYAMIARLARLLRIARLISTIPELRLIVSTLVRSIPSMGHVLLLMGVIFYIYAVAGYHLFHQHDPEHWRNLGISLLTLFRVVTLEDWTDVMYKAMELHHLFWLYFVSFVTVGTFVVINLFIAVVLNNLEEAKQERLEQLQSPPSKDDILKELKQTQAALAKLQQKLENAPGH